MAQQVPHFELDEAVKRSPKKWVYLFTEGNGSMRALLGNKGAGMAEMTNAGLPVPPGFTITTEACNTYQDNQRQFPGGAWEQIQAALKIIEQQTGKRLGAREAPLLVSVRTGTKQPIPGIMNTILNLGMNDETVEGLIARTGDPHFAYDTYQRFIEMFSKGVLHVAPEHLERVLESHKRLLSGGDIPIQQIKRIVNDLKLTAEQVSGQPFPNDTTQQLRQAIETAFISWNQKSAQEYRTLHKIPHDLGAAVTIQMMAFGNIGPASGTGIVFTRNPGTGTQELYGEYLLNAQGEDVVAGQRLPLKIDQLQTHHPHIYKEFEKIAYLLEHHYRDMQDIEFTVEENKLYLLQTRTAQRTAQATIKIAVSMVEEALITREEAVQRVEPNQVYQLLLPRFGTVEKTQARGEGRLLAQGLNVSPGAAHGKAVFNATRAEQLSKEGVPIIFIKQETGPDDIHAMLMARGILTARGGATSHAAVVARGLGRPCVSGCEEIRINETRRVFTTQRKTDIVIKEGDDISIDGTTGEVFAGIIPVTEANFDQETDLKTILGWADKIRKLAIWANTDYPRDAQRAIKYGAEGIGLCRTEHMFMKKERLPIVRKMILSRTKQERQQALDQLLPLQKNDFKELFEAMIDPQTGACHPVVIRLMDLPLNEFFPSYEDLLIETTRLEGQKGHETELYTKRLIRDMLGSLRENNPMLGLRGCRLGLLFPEITLMQTRAILEAATLLIHKGKHPRPKIMIPLIGHINELAEIRRQLETVADQITLSTGLKIDYQFGTMIELPRAALTADQLASVADFFSFGTNDLTQTTFGYSRDDAEGKFLLKYIEGVDAPGLKNQIKILPANPFQTLDREGVGQLISMAIEKGRRTNPKIELGICGEHGGDPNSIAFFNEIGLDYISCSPFRVPIARLAAAQATLSQTPKDEMHS